MYIFFCSVNGYVYMCDGDEKWVRNMAENHPEDHLYFFAELSTENV